MIEIPLAFPAFAETLASAERRFQRRLIVLKRVIAREYVYLFGYGAKGRALAQHIAQFSSKKVIVYDSDANARKRAEREGFGIVDSVQEIRPDCGVILGACQAQLEQARAVPQNYIYYQEAAYLFDAPYLENRAREFSSWIVQNTSALYQTYIAVHAQSREKFVNVLSFKLSLDPHDLIESKQSQFGMWFDVLEDLSSRKYRTFLDVGAYDGDTLREAQRRLFVTRGIAFEANSSLFDSIRRNASTYECGVTITPRAAWSHSCRLKFYEVGSGMIAVSEAEDGELEAGPIDDSIDEPVDFIKMDIEGAEIAALTGCTRTLSTGPDLAIAAYHRPDDLTQIPLFLERSGYAKQAFDLHVAHYSDCFDDTILYFLKR